MIAHHITLLIAYLLIFSNVATAQTIKSCPVGTSQVRAHFRKAYYRSSGTFVSSTNVKESCRELSPGEARWFPKINDGRPEGWPHKSEASVHWTDDERDRLVEAMDSLPEIVQATPIKSVFRMKSSVFKGNPAAHANGLIVLYDHAFDAKANLARIIAHEIGHEIFGGLPESGVEYRKATGWHPEWRGEKFYMIGRKSGYVADDGDRSPDEDFANNFEFFLFEKEKLTLQTPEAEK